MLIFRWNDIASKPNAVRIKISIETLVVVATNFNNAAPSSATNS